MNFEQAAAKLEFDRILARIQRHISSDPGREILGSLPVLTSLSEIRTELAQVTEFKRVLEVEGDIPLEGIFSLSSALHRATIDGSVLSPREFLQIRSTLRVSRDIRSFFSRCSNQYPILWAVAAALEPNKILEFNIDGAIDESEEVKDDASRELQSIRRSIVERYEQLRKRLEQILKDVSEQGFSQEEIITTREGRMVIPVKTEHKLRVPGFIHSTSASGATAFIEPTETLEMNNAITSLQFQERREVTRILAALTGQVRDVREQLSVNLAILAKLDVLRARAKYSIEILGVEPFVNDSGPVRLMQARHPILLTTHGHARTIPLDLELGDAFQTLVISGPNAGGKSVAMKCVGLLSLMVQSGIHIPASDQSTFPVFTQIFVDIGDEQSIENDLSTFSSHLANLKEIVASANKNSLVLIDEIGSGTDPAEGGAIAAAVLEVLTRRGSFTIATTHHGFLKVFAHETNGIENGAMEFDRGTLSPTYRFRPGVPGSSFALEMAMRLDVGDAILARSRELLGDQQTRLESLISELESTTQNYRKELEFLLDEKRSLDQLMKEYQSRLSKQKTELREIKKEAQVEAREILTKANAVIERSVREIRESGGDRVVAKKVREEVAHLKEEISQWGGDEPEPVEDKSGEIRVGSFVRLRTGTETGRVEAVAVEKQLAFVVFGNVRMKVHIPDLVPSVPQAQPPHPGGTAAIIEKPEAVLHDLDLRGMTGDEAIPLVDKFIDSAVLAGLGRVDIIHGKGTGALRKKVTDHLSRNPHVRSFRLGEWNEGGAGATVVELKD